MPKISMVIPTYTLSRELEGFAIDAILSYRDQVDELIVSEDGGMFSYRIMDLVDKYIYNNTNVGFTKNVNNGWRLSTGEYTMIVNSDTSLEKGKLDDLCIEGKVTSPSISGQEIEYLAGPFFVVPRTVLFDRGYLLDSLHTYCSDSEFDNRVRDIFEPVDSVRVYHAVSQTVTPAGVNTERQHTIDEEQYKYLKEIGVAK